MTSCVTYVTSGKGLTPVVTVSM